MTVFALEQHAGQFHPLAGRAQAHLPQTLDRLAVIALGLAHEFLFRTAACPKVTCKGPPKLATIMKDTC